MMIVGTLILKEKEICFQGTQFDQNEKKNPMNINLI